MEVYCEQNVENKKIDKKRTKMRVLNILRFVLLVVGIVLSYLMIIGVMGAPIKEGETVNWTVVILQLVFALLILVPFILSFIFIGKYINNSNVEFDYLINNGVFRIIKVVNRKKRKKMLEFHVSAIESFGKLDSETYDRFAASKEVKKVFAVCDYENEDGIYYLYYGSEGQRYLVHLEPNEEMLMAIKRSVSRISIIDKSVKLASMGSAK